MRLKGVLPKSEIRNPKSETSTNTEIQMNKTILTASEEGFAFSKLVFWICFEFRYSRFAFEQQALKTHRTVSSAFELMWGFTLGERKESRALTLGALVVVRRGMSSGRTRRKRV